MAVTKTIGPLHFEDLEPKRFEDLVRQLVYDFKPWRRLEATGRAGSDDGFDARGYEMVGGGKHDANNENEDGSAEYDKSDHDRLWLIQCKREKTITPKKLAAYADEIKLNDGESLYGMVFVAACDFSKGSRDIFRQKCEQLGIEEWHLWGKAELEDLLFQPKNDSLLFAYFGISLTIRRRSLRSNLIARLATKRRAKNVLDGKKHAHILVVDANCQGYPTPADDHATHPKWFLAQYHGLHHNGLLFLVQRHFAFLEDDGKSWDAALVQNDALPHRDPWSDSDDHELRSELFRFWSDLPKQNQAWAEVIGLIPFDKVLAIDEIGDDIVAEPHVYAEFTSRAGPFLGFSVSVKTADRWSGMEFHPKSLSDSRIVKFSADRRVVGQLGPYGPKSYFEK